MKISKTDFILCVMWQFLMNLDCDSSITVCSTIFRLLAIILHILHYIKKVCSFPNINSGPVLN